MFNNNRRSKVNLISAYKLRIKHVELYVEKYARVTGPLHLS